MDTVKGELIIEMQLAVIIFLLGLMENRLSQIWIELKIQYNDPLKERRDDEK